MKQFKTLENASLKNAKVLLRVDVNVPIVDGIITDDTRLQHILPTINELRTKGACVILLAHFGRPQGKVTPTLSLRPISVRLAELLGEEVFFSEEIVGETVSQKAKSLQAGQILMLENVRFMPEEEANDDAFSQKLAALADLYVNDAFSAAHRAHASTYGVVEYLPSYVGRGMQAELAALNKALLEPKRPVLAVVGGAKVSTKMELLENLLEKVDVLLIGGGMANTFLAARGYNVGKSLCENDYLETARQIEDKALKMGKQILLPQDVVVAKEFKANAEHRTCALHDIAPDEMILDVGAKTIEGFKSVFASMKTIVWNGPLGAFELNPFDNGTNQAALLVADLSRKGYVMSVAGGGDTVSALNHAGAGQDFTYLSTAGGAFLEWLEGKSLPGLDILEQQGVFEPAEAV